MSRRNRSHARSNKPRSTPLQAVQPGQLQQHLADVDAAWRATVRAALAEGSVRQVAVALGVSPTTVQKWPKEAPGA